MQNTNYGTNCKTERGFSTIANAALKKISSSATTCVYSQKNISKQAIKMKWDEFTDTFWWVLV